VIRELKISERAEFDSVARHPLQSWSWGEFRKQTGLEVTRLVEIEDEQIVNTFQITWHRIPKTSFFIGYCPKSVIPSKEAMDEIGKIAKKKKAIFVKFEPNEILKEESAKKIKELMNASDLKEGKSLFTKYSLWLDIDHTEEDILQKMHQKTRYNTRLAEKKGVQIIEDDTDEGFEDYWKLMEETTKRQRFFAHSKNYHRKMWRAMSESGMGHLFKAVFEGKVLTAWILFVFNGVLYYPYGSSSNENREVMASNLMMWEAIRFGKKNKCNLFDMWGSLGPEPDMKDPWFGFHRFKLGYGSRLVEFVGTYDLVINRGWYQIYEMMDKLRWFALKVLARLRK
jgi:lipid II:glycine glycyltransferase (peptidoglycan interpeptide bridge formation enzyme)